MRACVRAGAEGRAGVCACVPARICVRAERVLVRVLFVHVRVRASRACARVRVCARAFMCVRTSPAPCGMVPSTGAAQTLRFLVNRWEGGRPARVWATNRSVNRRLALRFMVNRKGVFRGIILI